MAFEKDTQHARILEVVVTADESDDTLAVTAVNWYRGRAAVIGATGKAVPFTGGAAAANCEVQLATTYPAPSVIRLKSTFQA